MPRCQEVVIRLDALKAPSVSSCNSIGDPERLLDGTRGRNGLGWICASVDSLTGGGRRASNHQARNSLKRPRPVHCHRPEIIF